MRGTYPVSPVPLAVRREKPKSGETKIDAKRLAEVIDS